MTIQLWIAALGLIRELLKYLRESKSCDCKEKQRLKLVHMAAQVKQANYDKKTDLKIIV